MTTHNSNQNLSVTGVNNSVKAPLNLLENENISSLDLINDRNKILFEQLVYLNRLMCGYHEFVEACFLSHPDLQNLSLSTEAIQLDINKRLKSILELATNH